MEKEIGKEKGKGSQGKGIKGKTGWW